MTTVCQSCGGWTRISARPECTEPESHRDRAGRAMSLREEQDYYAERAVDYTIPKRERDLWQQLADELGRRLGTKPNSDQPELW